MIRKFTVAFASLLVSTSIMARDDVLHLPLADVLELPAAKARLDGSVKFYLAGAVTPAAQKQLGIGVSNRKTNGVGKSDVEACKWAALSALLAFQDSAKQKSANAVVNLVSYYKKAEFRSATEYECHAGDIMAGVAFRGEYASVDR